LTTVGRFKGSKEPNTDSDTDSEDVALLFPSRDNVCGAIENGFIHSVHVDCRGFCEQLWNEVKCPLGMDHLCDARKVDDSVV
jgi:hypothetical protein